MRLLTEDVWFHFPNLRMLETHPDLSVEGIRSQQKVNTV